jgi:hypothetical protein
VSDRANIAFGRCSFARSCKFDDADGDDIGVLGGVFTIKNGNIENEQHLNKFEQLVLSILP